MGAGGAALAVLPLLISGYLFNLIFYPLRFFSQRAEGQKLFFMAAGSGLILGSVVSIGIVFLKRWDGYPGSGFADMAALLHEAIPLPHVGKMVATILASVALAFLANLGCTLWKLLRGKGKRGTGKMIYEFMIRRFGNSMAQLFSRAANEQKTVLLTMSSRKIYCGRILEMPVDIDADDACIELLPIFSGYRDKDTLQMGKSKTRYPDSALWEARRYLESIETMRDELARPRDLRLEVDGEYRQRLLDQIERDIASARDIVGAFGQTSSDIKDWIKVLPVREIESASFFDSATYEEWFVPNGGDGVELPAESSGEMPVATTPP